jgi:hypothetical protein
MPGGKNVVISGNFDMTSGLTAKGSTERFGESLAEHLTGSVKVATRDGEIRKMKLLGNILALRSSCATWSRAMWDSARMDSRIEASR